MNKFFKILLFGFVIFLFGNLAEADENRDALWEGKEEIIRGEIIEIIEEGKKIIPGTSAEANYQLLKVKILEGRENGSTVNIENDFLSLKLGDKIFLKHILTNEAEEFYSLEQPDRRRTLLFFTALFAAAVLIFGRFQGFRSLISLGGSFFIIIYFFLPKILNGAPPVLTSIVFSSFILVFTIFITHGFNKKSSSAILGTVITIIFTGFLAYFAVNLSRLSGFASDEAIYLNFATGGQLNFSGLLLGAIIIGVLGILDDIAITQAACVREIHSTDPQLSRKQVYKKALVIGREHVGALVNTLALAYAGAALPLLLLLYTLETPLSLILNGEIFATEIIRTVVGSISLVLAVPITTIIACYMLIRQKSVE